jgi:hypothetical protein
VLVVARADADPEQAEDLKDLLRRLRIAPIGLVAVGARAEISPYYLSERLPGPAGTPGEPRAASPASPAPR